MVAYDCYLFRMKRLAKRLLSILLTIIVVSLIVFLLQEYALGDSASYILSEDAGGSAADIFRASVSADGSLMERYISFLQATVILSVLTELFTTATAPEDLSLPTEGILLIQAAVFIWDQTVRCILTVRAA